MKDKKTISFSKFFSLRDKSTFLSDQLTNNFVENAFKRIE